MGEICASGSVGGEGGNALAYPATWTASMPATSNMTGEATSGVNREGDSTILHLHGRPQNIALSLG
jgi:hypothetical protein